MQRKSMEMRVLKVELTEEELGLKGKELARVSMEEGAAEAAIQKATSDFKLLREKLRKALADVIDERVKLAQQISSRTIERDVRCTWHYELEGGFKILVRDDTGHAIRRESLGQEERQMLIGEKLQKANKRQLDMWAQQLAELPPEAQGRPAPEPDKAEGEGEEQQEPEGEEPEGEEGGGDD